MTNPNHNTDDPVLEELQAEQERNEAQGDQQIAQAMIPPEAAQMMQQQPAIPGLDPASIQQGVQNVQETVNQQAPGMIENFQTQAGAFLKGRSVEEEAAWRQEQQAKMAEASARFEEQTRGDPAREVISAGIGGTLDAVDSLTQFGELVGDTGKHALNKVLGKPTDPTQNPWDENYIDREVDWLDIPESWKPEMHTGVGKFARGLIEFGLLVRWTGKAGQSVLGPKTMLGGAARGLPVVRSANQVIQGNKYLTFAEKAVKIGADGAIADLISTSSEAGNIANLAEQHVPWLAPQIMQAIAVRPEDNTWTARIKTMLAGSGFNYVGHVIGAFGKGLWRYVDDLKLGKTAEEATENANQVYKQEIEDNLRLDEEAATNMAAQDLYNGDGVSRESLRQNYVRTHLDEEDLAAYIDPATSAADRQVLDELANKIGKSKGDGWDVNTLQSEQQFAKRKKSKPTPHVNPERYSGPERATYRGGLGENYLREATLASKKGGDPVGGTNIATESQIRAVSRGNLSFREYVEEVLGDMANKAFRDLDNRMNEVDIRMAIHKMASPMIDQIEDFRAGKLKGTLADNFRKALDDPKNKRFYIDDGNKITTISPSLKGANVIALHSLARTVSDIALGTVSIADNIPIGRQADMVFDAMKVIFAENKKMGFMWSLDGHAQQWGFKLPKAVSEATQARLAVMDEQIEQYFEQLHQLSKAERWREMKGLMELHALSDGHVRTMTQVHEYLAAKWRGGRMDDVHIKGKLRQNVQGVFFNMILGAPRTIHRAVFGTNSIAMMRPITGLIGAKLPWTSLDEKDAVVAAAQIDSMMRAWGESMKMAQRNWDLGVARKNQDYIGRFDLEKDMQEWKALRPHYEQFGDLTQLTAYDWMDKIVDFNTNPWVKYSQNAMGAGDAFARTVIGRQAMAKKAALAALSEGTPLSQVRKITESTEKAFRKEIFDKNADGFWIVKDKAAMMAGDEAAMTRVLLENFEGFEKISNIPGMKIFFPLVRPGFNYLDLVFQHTPAVYLRDKYHDLIGRPRATGEPVSLEILQKYGLKAEEVAQEVAIIEGRLAIGNSVVAMGMGAAMTGHLTGSMPYDKKDRDLWKLNKVQPDSFKIGDKYFPVRDNVVIPEVFAPILSFSANIFAYQDVLGEKMTDQMVKKLTWMAASMIIDQSMLSGIGDMAMLMDPEATGERQIDYVLARVARSHIPIPAALMSELGTILDATQKEANNFWEMLIRRDALVKSTLKQKFDVASKDRSGKPLYYGPENGLLRLWNSLTPTAIVPVEDDPIKKGLAEIRFNMPEVLSEIDGVELNSDQRSDLQRILSMTFKDGWDLRARLEYTMLGGGSKRYKETLQAYKDEGLKITDGYDLKKAVFYSMVWNVFQDGKAKAKEELKAKYPKLAAALEIQAQKDYMLKTGNVNPHAVKTIKENERLHKLKNYATNP